MKTLLAGLRRRRRKKPTPIADPQGAAELDAESASQGQGGLRAASAARACHGELGRGDGTSAPTLKDDWGNPIRPADLTKRWTFRGGPTREDIFRTFTTGLNGTPMPSFAESLTDEERWQLVDYIVSPRPARRARLRRPACRSPWTRRRARPRRSGARALRRRAAGATSRSSARSSSRAAPSIPSANGIDGARGLQRRGDRVPPHLARHARRHGGHERARPRGAARGGRRRRRRRAGGERRRRLLGRGGGGGGRSGARRRGRGAAATSGARRRAPPRRRRRRGEFSDAVAIQLPVAAARPASASPTSSSATPQNPVDLWFVDLAHQDGARATTAPAAPASTPVEARTSTAVASYDQGEWSVIFKRSLRGERRRHLRRGRSSCRSPSRSGTASSASAATSAA